MKKLRTETERLVEEMQQAAAREDTLRMLTAADEVLRREPTNADAMFVAGTAFMTNGHEGVAAIILNSARCHTKDPARLGAIWNNIGYALQGYQPEEAYRALKESLKYGEAPAGTYDNLCNLASQIGRHAEALQWAEKANGGDPNGPCYNRAFALLHMGRWEEAWRDYAKSVGTEARPRTERTYDLPRWDGKKKGRVIIHGEQGVGDEIMFMSMCPADFDGVIECSPRMEALFARSFPKAAVYGTLLNNYLEWPLKERADYHIEMGGLGEFYAQEPFARGGFLAADSARCAAWASWLRYSGGDQSSFERAGGNRSAPQGGTAPGVGATSAGLPRRALDASANSGLLVGISWTGGTWTTGRSKRSIPFELIRDKLIAQHPDVTFVCLEYEDRREELADHPQVLNPHWATKKGADMDDLAALCSNLDLIITATNSTVDMAGALGVPVWALVPHNPPWRYSEAAGQDQMWFYESVRTFRQDITDDGDWERVMSNVTTALHKLKLPKPKLQLVNAEPDNDGWRSC